MKGYLDVPCVLCRRRKAHRGQDKEERQRRSDWGETVIPPYAYKIMIKKWLKIRNYGQFQKAQKQFKGEKGYGKTKKFKCKN